MVRLAFKIVAKEHAAMPKICPECGGEMEFFRQQLVIKPKPGDILIYRCKKCGKAVKKFFEFPEEYAKFFRSMNQSSPD